MRGVQVYDFGVANGIKTYRVSGDREDLEQIIHECRNADADFAVSPELEYVYRGMWSVLLQLKISSQA